MHGLLSRGFHWNFSVNQLYFWRLSLVHGGQNWDFKFYFWWPEFFTSVFSAKHYSVQKIISMKLLRSLVNLKFRTKFWSPRLFLHCRLKLFLAYGDLYSAVFVVYALVIASEAYCYFNVSSPAFLLQTNFEILSRTSLFYKNSSVEITEVIVCWSSKNKFPSSLTLFSIWYFVMEFWLSQFHNLVMEFVMGFAWQFRDFVRSLWWVSHHSFVILYGVCDGFVI